MSEDIEGKIIDLENEIANRIKKDLAKVRTETRNAVDQGIYQLDTKDDIVNAVEHLLVAKYLNSELKKFQK